MSLLKTISLITFVCALAWVAVGNAEPESRLSVEAPKMTAPMIAKGRIKAGGAAGFGHSEGGTALSVSPSIDYFFRQPQFKRVLLKTISNGARGAASLTASAPEIHSSGRCARTGLRARRDRLGSTPRVRS